MSIEFKRQPHHALFGKEEPSKQLLGVGDSSSWIPFPKIMYIPSIPYLPLATTTTATWINRDTKLLSLLVRINVLGVSCQGWAKGGWEGCKNTLTEHIGCYQ
jgi:hypothetical protein